MNNNVVDYFEIGTPDGEASRTFYSGLFGWDIADKPTEQGYRSINQYAGGISDTSTMGGGNWGIFYVHVEDVKAALEKAVELGATVAVPFTTGGGIDFAHLVDPQGNRFGIWRPTEGTETPAAA